jgi:hypothetical protein
MGSVEIQLLNYQILGYISPHVRFLVFCVFGDELITIVADWNHFDSVVSVVSR